MRESERTKILDLDSRDAKSMTTMLFSFEEGDAKGSIIWRRAQRPRRDIDLNKFTQVLRGSASDDLIAGASYFVFNSLFCGEPVQLLEKRFGVFCSTRFKDEFGCRVLYLIIIHNSYIVPNPTRLAQSTSQFRTRMDIRINTWNMYTLDDPTSTAKPRQTCTHPGTISATQTCMQCSNTWTIEISHNCKSDTKSNKNWVLLEGLGEQVGFQLWLKWGVCLCVADRERQIILGYGTLIGERSLAWVFLFEQRDLQFTCVCSRP